MSLQIKPLVSIIIPNYNHEKFLTQRLESVFNQTFQDFEVILLDDCSSDNSILILKQYANHPKVSHCIFNTNNSGSPFIQWDRGIKASEGKYIWIAESDDFCDIDFLTKLLKPLLDNDSLGIAYCQTNDVDENGIILKNRISYTQIFQPNIWEKSFSQKGEDFVKLYLSFFNVIPNASAVIFKKELLETSFLLASVLKMKMCGDWYFWIKIMLNSEVFFLNETLNYFRNHNSVTRNHTTILKKRQRLLEEKEVRSFLQSIKLNNFESEKVLYNRWFKLYSFRNLFRKSFYEIKLDQTSYFSFFKTYFFLKSKKIK
ncbi:hypothetical protein GCM10022422_19330 [Flavobacterium ginsengisoli]|uniref:Glycosyltransferase 2-like domain-containing protein n=1 Tax=Flavobacterium ginsengisoli TaxID=871694 RepID=A0ABP7FCG0_9FLAO|nr:glycosyltransferase family 2 protein [Flavobacterium ginsengisoli]